MFIRDTARKAVRRNERALDAYKRTRRREERAMRRHFRRCGGTGKRMRRFWISNYASAKELFDYESALGERQLLERYEAELRLFGDTYYVSRRLDAIFAQLIHVWKSEDDLQSKISGRESPRALYRKYDLLFLVESPSTSPRR